MPEQLRQQIDARTIKTISLPQKDNNRTSILEYEKEKYDENLKMNSDECS